MWVCYGSVMKAIPMRYDKSLKQFFVCEASDATHITIDIPGPTRTLTVPVIQSGTRHGTPNWTWNGSVENPTLAPSLLTHGENWTDHLFVTNGNCIFLSDCTHEHKGNTLPLNEIQP